MGESPKQKQMNLKGAKAQSKGLHNSSVRHSKYRILGLVGQGQFGRVFCASVRQASPKQSAGQLVALKELSHQQAPTSEFLRELWFLITLQHPNIVTCRALEHTATGRYLVMDYCEGGTLRSLLKQDRPLRLLEGLQLVIGVLAGLDYTHRRGVVHCDIKPENILLTLGPKGWLPRLSDFGIARRLPEVGTSRGNQEMSPDATVGSPAYMAPERFYGLYSPMSDIYAVGILLFEMLMGYRPFSGPPGKLMWAHLNQRLQLPERIPEPLQEIIKKSLEKLPARRYASAAQMAQALRLVMYDPQVRQLGDGIIPWQTGEASKEEEDENPSVPIAKPKSPQPPPIQATDSSSRSSQNLEKQQTSDRLDVKLAPIVEISSPLILTSPLTTLVTSSSYLYGASRTGVTSWCQPEKQPVTGTTRNSMVVPEAVHSLLPAPSGCYALTRGGVYWVNNDSSNLILPKWSMAQGEAEVATASVNLEDKASQQIPIAPSKLDCTYKAATDPKSRWLAVATQGKLCLYSLLEESFSSGKQSLSLVRSLSLPENKLPELMFLDGRHILTIWSGDKEQPQTAFRVYTRRGTLVGEVRLSATVAHLQAGAEPYTLLGIVQGAKSAVLLIHLQPLNVKRIPLETIPACACTSRWGYVLADAQGKIVVLDRKGYQLGNFRGPVAPIAIAPWGKTGLAVATHTGSRSQLHFVDIEPGLSWNSDRQSFL